MTDPVLLYDTTLRDGMQGEGMSLSADEKVRVAHALDDLGVHFVEAGFPSSNPKEEALFELLAGERFEHAEIAAFGMTRRRELAADDDPALRLLAGCFAPVCTLVGKTWSLHLQKVTRVDPEENLRMIAESVGFLHAQGKRVIYDAEHFFDAHAEDAAYALRCLRAAADAGAENLTLCDTNGATLPSTLAAAVADVVGQLGGRVGIGIHTHDDAGCGVANSLVAVEAGARLVQGTMNGYGERCGNANLVTILADLQLKLGFECVTTERLGRLTETAHLVDELCNVAPDPDQPYVGANAFAHKGGMHVAGVARDARTFEHVDPALVGSGRRVLVSELAGRGTVQARAGERGMQIDDATATRVVDRVKELEHRGFQLEAADGSLDLLIRRETGAYEPLFRLESWRVIVEKRESVVTPAEEHSRIAAGGAQPERGGRSAARARREERSPIVDRASTAARLSKRAPQRDSQSEHRSETFPASTAGLVLTEATIKIWVDGERYVRTAEGNGPVNALDAALRSAIGETYPHLRDIELVNFKVRILDERKGTAAVTRVLLDATDGHATWGAIGVSENIIEASWDALVDSLEAGMLPAPNGVAGALDEAPGSGLPAQ